MKNIFTDRLSTEALGGDIDDIIARSKQILMDAFLVAANEKLSPLVFSSVTMELAARMMAPFSTTEKSFNENVKFFTDRLKSDTEEWKTNRSKYGNKEGK